MKQALENKKGLDIVVLDVNGLSSITDYYVLVSGKSAPHLKALFQEVQRSMKDVGNQCFRKSGTPESGWIVCDYVNFVVHIFTAETRRYYEFEQLWSDAKKI